MKYGIATACLLAFSAFGITQCQAKTSIDPGWLMETPVQQAATLNRVNQAELANTKRLFFEKYGRRAQRFWGNSDDDFFSVPGVEKNLRLASNMNNRNLAKGALRTNLYAREIDDNPDWDLLGVNKPIQTPLGKTDADLIMRNRVTGEVVHIEVKDVQEENLLKNMEKYKTQIDKLAADAERGGYRQVWVNRNGIPPELQEYAEERGVQTSENVATGEKSLLRPGTSRFRDVLDDLSGNGKPQLQAGGRLNGTPMRAGDGDGTVETANAAEGETSLSGDVPGAVLADGAGIAEGADGEAALASAFLDQTAVDAACSADEVVAVAVVAGVVIYNLYEWRSGRMSTREFVTSSGGLGGFAGGLAGGEAGAAVASFIHAPGTAVGAGVGLVVGGIGGALAESDAAESGANLYHQYRDSQLRRRQRKDLLAFLIHYYAQPATGKSR